MLKIAILKKNIYNIVHLWHRSEMLQSLFKFLSESTKVNLYCMCCTLKSSHNRINIFIMSVIFPNLCFLKVFNNLYLNL